MWRTPLFHPLGARLVVTNSQTKETSSRREIGKTITERDREVRHGLVIDDVRHFNVREVRHGLVIDYVRHFNVREVRHFNVREVRHFNVREVRHFNVTLLASAIARCRHLVKITLPADDHTPYQYHKIPYQKISHPISITRLHSLRSISENSTLYQYQKFTLPTEDPTPHQHQKIPYQKIPHPINIRRPHFLRSISQDPVPYQYQKIPLPTEDPTPSAREASWRRVFDPYAPLLFNLYYYLEQTLHFG